MKLNLTNSKRAGATTICANALPSSQSGSSAAAPVPRSLERRLLLAAPLVGSLALAGLTAAQPAAAAPAAEAGFAVLEDKTLAYSFVYPTEGVNLTFSRRPEKYSSAAPLTADARQRIVCELVDLSKAFTVSVSVGPPSAILSTRPSSEWKPKETAESVLIDKSTARVSTGQRVALNSIEELKAEERDGRQYITYEHISQGSPNRLSPTAKETFRHALSVTTVRDGSDGTPYLFTYNIACPDELWDQYEGAIRKAIASFRLEETTRDYVAPNENPWMFF